MDLKCIIIDDEKPARKILKHYVERVPFLENIGDFGNPLNALELLKTGQVDLIFIDIRMPTISGLDFIRTLESKPAIILTTAYREFALEGFELEVEDYLLKPISFERFLRGVNKIKERFRKPETPSPEGQEEFLVLKSDKRLIRVPIHEILLIQGSREYVIYNTLSMGKIMVHGTMKKLEETLTDKVFLRVHRSYFVNTTYLRVFKGNILVVGDQEVPVSATYKDQLLNFFSY